MTEYVLGFAFDDLNRVALIRKNRPDWQAGKWNGIGGHVEPHETTYGAMIREFYEEAGVLTSAVDWRHAGMIHGNFGLVYVFTITSRAIRDVRTCTDEEVRLFGGHVIDLERNVLPNVSPMVRMCAQPDIKSFELWYK